MHYGLWIKNFPKKTQSLIDIEIQLFEQIIDLFHGQANQWVGFINSGASMGNFYSLLICREWLKKKKYKKISLFYNQLTHDSIKSSAKILNINTNQSPLNSSWQIDLDQIRNKLKKIHKQEAVIIFLTWGYKKTGTVDDLDKCQQIIDELKVNDQVLICLDAAFDGLIIPFSTSPVFPLEFKSLFCMTIDFHKYLRVPAPAGGVLFRKKIMTNDKFINQA